MTTDDAPTAPGRAELTVTVATRADGRKHLRVPIPIDWLSRAALLPGRSLHVGIALWVMRGLRKSHIVSLTNITGHCFGLDRNAKYRGLSWLEQAGLVSVQRKLGRAPMVTIRECGGDRERQS